MIQPGLLITCRLFPPEGSIAIVRHKIVLHSKFFHRGKKKKILIF